MPSNPVSNPKSNLNTNPNRRAISIGGNCPDTCMSFKNCYSRQLLFQLVFFEANCKIPAGSIKSMDLFSLFTTKFIYMLRAF